MDFEIEDDEDVILEESELHKALKGIGYTDIDYAPIHKIKSVEPGKTSPIVKLSTWGQSIHEKMQFYYRQTTQENRVREEQLKTILKSRTLLDDHALEIVDFLNENCDTRWKKTLEWLPLAGSLLAASLCSLILRQRNVLTFTIAVSTLGFTTYEKYQRLAASRNLKKVVTLQNELHYLCKRALKVLRIGQRSHDENSRKFEILGEKKQKLIDPLKELMLQIFKNLSKKYYENSKIILKLLPPTICSNGLVTELKDECPAAEENDEYQCMKNWYYTYILAQSEMLHLVAVAYNGCIKWDSYSVPEKKLSCIFNELVPVLSKYHFKASEIIEDYEKCEIQPIHREFRNSSNSKFQEVYIHLDLTSNRIQMSYEQITSILNKIDSLKDEADDNILESLMQNMDEAYKQIEMAKSFAEFSTLLLAKIQHQICKKSSPDVEFPLPSLKEPKTIVIDCEPEILDEVFEEYIKEEYLKPMCEDCEEDVQDHKLNKLLAKNLMGELKEVLIEKQKIMSEREMKALKRMYKNIKESSFNDQSQIDVPVPPVPPPLPPTIKPQINEGCFKKVRTPVPLPRAKTFKTVNDAAEIPRFSIAECSSTFILPSNFKCTEETFVGSGENSDEELASSISEDDPEIK